jgi:hypothetical protein
VVRNILLVRVPLNIIKCLLFNVVGLVAFLVQQIVIVKNVITHDNSNFVPFVADYLSHTFDILKSDLRGEEVLWRYWI